MYRMKINVLSAVAASVAALTLAHAAAKAVGTLALLPPSAVVTAHTTVDNPSVLRGYGRVKSVFETVTAAGATCRVWRFDATSTTNAKTVVGKFLADITLSPGSKRDAFTLAGHDLELVTVEGGSWYTGYVVGSTGIVIAAESAASLKSFVSAVPALKSPSVAVALPYPAYLDRFDRHGWGFYGFRADWQNTKRDQQTDPTADMDWIDKNKFRFELWPNPTGFDDSYSVPETHDQGWLIAESEKRGVPISGRLYGGLPHVKEYTDGFEQPMSFMEGGWYWATLGWRGIPHQSWFNSNGRLYVARQAQNEIKVYKDHPEIESWMLPYGEMSYYDWYAYHADRSPSAVASWHDTIQNKLKLSLSELSAMYNQRERPFKSYDEVPVPEVATFAGLPHMILELEGDWYVRPETTKDEGIAGKWWNADVTAAPWEKMHMPGSVFWWKYAKKVKWAVRDFDVSAADLASGKTIYLYDYARANENDPRSFVPVYLNGQSVGTVRTWGAFDVTKLLKPGRNRIALQTELFGGRVFLSTEPQAVYPYLGTERNRLWLAFNDWLLDSKYDTSAVALAAMRETEPNKPIKIMAPTGIGSDRWLSLGSRFGAWGHFTGEGVWAFFWYKRYGYLYGLPGTSEGGGPCNTVDDQIKLYQRVFLEGLNGHDQVFTVQDVSGRAPLKQWYDDHIAVLKQMGRYDIAGPQVVVLRCTGTSNRLMPAADASSTQKTPEIQSYWNWDIARGTLQSIGQSGLYLDDTGLAQHKNAKYPILIDGGNEILTAATVKNLEAFVRGGGTYVTLPFTGRSLPDQPDAWPIKKLTGCEITKMRTPGAGKGTIQILAKQSLFTEMAGKTYADAGSSMDWQDFEHNILSTELKPAPGSEVVARFDDGAPAIVVRHIGKGKVIVLGTAFFKGVHDVMGIWWPTELESTFYRDLLTNLGQPSPNNAGDYRVFTQRYRTNNGLDDVVVVDNFAGADRNVTLRVAVGPKPARVYRVAMNAITDVPFTMQGNSAVIANVAIPKDEVQIYYLRRPNAVDASQYWLAYQQKLWKPTDPVKVDFKPLEAAGWNDPTVDLKPDWRWTQVMPVAPDWQQLMYNDNRWKRWGLDIFSAMGADSTKPIYCRKVFNVPHAWLRDGGVTKLTIAGWSWPVTIGDGSWKATLNGMALDVPGYFHPDVAKMLHDGPNVLTLELGPARSSKYIGVSGSVYLTHVAPAVKTVDLAGNWTSVHEAAPVTLALPGKGKAFAPQRTIDIPADWKGKYTITFHAIGSRESTIGVIVNETGMTRRHHHLFGNELETDLTPFLKFGQTNTIALLPTAGDWLPDSVNWDLSTVELRLYPKQKP